MKDAHVALEQGHYYIGDLCLILPDETWKEVCDLIFPNGESNEKSLDGVFSLKDGRKFGILNTANGDGVYDMHDGFMGRSGDPHKIVVESGTIGCMNTLSIEGEPDWLVDKPIANIAKPFYPFNNTYNGYMYFGQYKVTNGYKMQNI